MMTAKRTRAAAKLLLVNHDGANAGRMVSTCPELLKFHAIQLLRWMLWGALVITSMLFATAVSAQTQTYNNTTSGALNAGTPCNTALVRTFSVTNNFVLGDVDIGMRGSHAYRGDVRAALRHPDGTTVIVLNGNGAVFGDNFNFRLNDAGTQLVNTDGNGTNHLTTAVSGGYQHNFIPDNALAAFNGKSSAGTWSLLICDSFSGADDGVFLAASLYLTPRTAPFANLSLAKSVSTASPTSGQQITYTLVATNASNSTTTANATVRDQLPAGVTHISNNGGGSYNPATGIWTITSLAPNTTRTLTITVSVTAGAGSTVTNVAEIMTSSVADINSTPGNGVGGEDDIASVNFTVQGTRSAGIAPPLTCPDGSLAFDWAGRTWPPGSEVNNYTLAGFGAFNWAVQSPAPYLSIAEYGGVHPRLTTAAQNTTSLSLAIDFANRDQLSTTTVTLGEVVNGAQFTIFDVDYAANDFADLVRVTGKLNGVNVIPVLTNGLANYVIGNTAYGDQGSSDTQANGNVVVTFSSAIDSIVIEYGNHGLAPANPDGQAIQISGNIRICKPVADLLVTKSSTPVSDPVTGVSNTAFAIPQGVLRYCILLSNAGSATAKTIVANDVLPANLVYIASTVKSGTTCANAAVVEDDDATGADDTDTVGVSFDTATVKIAVPSLPGGQSVAVTYQATIQ